jgi:predicted RNA-binding protein
MCEATAYLLTDSGEQEVLESVDTLEVDGDLVTMVNIFGEQKTLPARIKAYRNSERKILLEAVS